MVRVAQPLVMLVAVATGIRCSKPQVVALQRVLRVISRRLCWVWVSMHPDLPLLNALHMMHQYGFRHVPIVEDGWPIGVVSVRDALGAELSQFENELRELEQVAAKL